MERARGTCLKAGAERWEGAVKGIEGRGGRFDGCP